MGGLGNFFPLKNKIKIKTDVPSDYERHDLIVTSRANQKYIFKPKTDFSLVTVFNRLAFSVLLLTPHHYRCQDWLLLSGYYCQWHNHDFSSPTINVNWVQLVAVVVCSCLPWFCVSGSGCTWGLQCEALKAGFPVLSGVYLIIRWTQHAGRRSHIPEADTETDTAGTSQLKPFSVWLKPEKWKQTEIVDKNGRECSTDLNVSLFFTQRLQRNQYRTWVVWTTFMILTFMVLLLLKRVCRIFFKK